MSHKHPDPIHWEDAEMLAKASCINRAYNRMFNPKVAFDRPGTKFCSYTMFPFVMHDHAKKNAETVLFAKVYYTSHPIQECEYHKVTAGNKNDFWVCAPSMPDFAQHVSFLLQVTNAAHNTYLTVYAGVDKLRGESMGLACLAALIGCPPFCFSGCLGLQHNELYLSEPDDIALKARATLVDKDLFCVFDTEKHEKMLGSVTVTSATFLHNRQPIGDKTKCYCVRNLADVVLFATALGDVVRYTIVKEKTEEQIRNEERLKAKREADSAKYGEMDAEELAKAEPFDIEYWEDGTDVTMHPFDKDDMLMLVKDYRKLMQQGPEASEAVDPNMFNHKMQAPTLDGSIASWKAGYLKRWPSLCESAMITLNKTMKTAISASMSAEKTPRVVTQTRVPVGSKAKAAKVDPMADWFGATAPGARAAAAQRATSAKPAKPHQFEPAQTFYTSKEKTKYAEKKESAKSKRNPFHDHDEYVEAEKERTIKSRGKARLSALKEHRKAGAPATAPGGVRSGTRGATATTESAADLDKAFEG